MHVQTGALTVLCALLICTEAMKKNKSVKKNYFMLLWQAIICNPSKGFATLHCMLYRRMTIMPASKTHNLRKVSDHLQNALYTSYQPRAQYYGKYLHSKIRTDFRKCFHILYLITMANAKITLLVSQPASAKAFGRAKIPSPNIALNKYIMPT